MRVQALSLLLLLGAALPEAGSPGRAVAYAHADAVKLPKHEAPYFRYLWVSTPAGKLRDEFLIALKFQVNLLSDQGTLATPFLIAPDVVRLDLRDYGWDKRLDVYEKLAQVDVFFHDKLKFLEDSTYRTAWPGGKDGSKSYERGSYRTRFKAGAVFNAPTPDLPGNLIYDLRFLLYTEAPVLMAEWFFVQVARQISIRNKEEGAGYYDFLGIKNRNDFFKLTGTDEKVAQRIFREWKAVVKRSGVSQQNRQVISLGAHSGRVWGTLDTFTEQGKGIARRNLRDGEFAHNAEEWFGFLPNGLPVMPLFNNLGVAQATAPDQIGPDDSPDRIGRDGRIHTCLSCIRCHGVDKDLLKPVNDWARKAFRQRSTQEYQLRLQDPDKRVTLELQSLYLRDIDRLLVRDREDYVHAVRQLTASVAHPRGLAVPRLTRMYAAVWNRYVEASVTCEQASRELGVTSEKLKESIARHAKVRGGHDLVLVDFLEGDSITRLEWEDSVSLARVLVLGLQPPEKVAERKAEKKEGK